MRHRVYGKHLGRDTGQRTALFKGLIRSLFLHETIITTEAKAKAIKGLVDRLIVKSKKKSPAGINEVKSFLPQVEVSRKLIEEIAPRYIGRLSGFTKLVRLGTRPGDGAMMVRMSLIETQKLEQAGKEKKEAEKKSADTRERNH